MKQKWLIPLRVKAIALLTSGLLNPVIDRTWQMVKLNAVHEKITVKGFSSFDHYLLVYSRSTNKCRIFKIDFQAVV